MDLASVGELDRIPEEVGEDLTQSSGVTDDGAGHIWGYLRHQFDPSLTGLDRQQPGGGVNKPRQIERDRLERQVFALDLGKIEDIVQDRQQ